jgi:hypothetical protein
MAEMLGCVIKTIFTRKDTKHMKVKFERMIR